MSAEVIDVDIHGALSQNGSLAPTMSLMKFKIRFFQLSTRICGHISDPSTFDEVSLHHFNKEIAEEQRLWDSTFLVDGSPSVLGSASYAHWCILQTYAHQLYLVIHRPFHHSQSPRFLPASREKCIESSTALLDIHRLLYELPRLRYYKWIVNGMTSFNALHGAVALASCLLDKPDSLDMKPYWAAFELTSQLVENMFKAWTTVTDGKYVMVIDHSSQIQICLDKNCPWSLVSTKTISLCSVRFSQSPISISSTLVLHFLLQTLMISWAQRAFSESDRQLLSTDCTVGLPSNHRLCNDLLSEIVVDGNYISMGFVGHVWFIGHVKAETN